jgi:flavodoxin
MNTSNTAAMVAITSMVLCASIACSSTPPDAVSGATTAIYEPTGEAEAADSNVLIVAAISKTGGTAKVARAIAEVFGARLASPRQVNAQELLDYSLIGFGSGIFDQKHHASILGFVESLPELPGRRVFIFSTSGVSRQFAIDHEIDDPHAILRESLRSKGLELVGEYNCAGFNNNSFLKLFGGMNKGKPDAQDIGRAKSFAGELRPRFLDPGASR